MPATKLCSCCDVGMRGSRSQVSTSKAQCNTSRCPHNQAFWHTEPNRPPRHSTPHHSPPSAPWTARTTQGPRAAIRPRARRHSPCTACSQERPAGCGCCRWPAQGWTAPVCEEGGGGHCTGTTRGWTGPVSDEGGGGIAWGGTSHPDP